MISEPLLTWATARAASLHMTVEEYIQFLVIGDRQHVDDMNDAVESVERRLLRQGKRTDKHQTREK